MPYAVSIKSQSPLIKSLGFSQLPNREITLTSSISVADSIFSKLELQQYSATQLEPLSLHITWIVDSYLFIPQQSCDYRVIQTGSELLRYTTSSSQISKQQLSQKTPLVNCFPDGGLSSFTKVAVLKSAENRYIFATSFHKIINCGPCYAYYIIVNNSKSFNLANQQSIFTVPLFSSRLIAHFQLFLISIPIILTPSVTRSKLPFAKSQMSIYQSSLRPRSEIEIFQFDLVAPQEEKSKVKMTLLLWL